MKHLKVVLSAILLALSTSVNASVLFTDLGSNNYGVSLDPISFTITSPGSSISAHVMVIEDFFQFGATTSGTDISGSMNYSVNGGSSVALDFNSSNGVFAGTSYQIDNNDLLFNFIVDSIASGATTVGNGDVVTLWTNNMIFNTTSTLTQAAGPYTADLLNFGVGIGFSIGTASVSAVPVPAAAWLFGSALLGFFGFSRRKANA